MDASKTGRMIRTLRLEKGLTQNQLGQMINVSGKAVSKWERGDGFPDVSIFPLLGAALGADTEELIQGISDAREAVSGNMKKLKFYVCPVCGNMLTAFAEASVCCCGKKLEPLVAKKAEGKETVNVEKIENDYYITSPHGMTKAHYISFVALITADGLYMKKQYPEWDLSCRISAVGHGMLIWHCSRHGLFYKNI